VENPRACYEPADAEAHLLGGNQPAYESLLNRRLQSCPLTRTSSRSKTPGLSQNADAESAYPSNAKVDLRA
jgi:hypothetical protein